MKLPRYILTDEQYHLKTNSSTASQSIFIRSDEVKEGEWVDSEGLKLKYFEWKTGEPNNNPPDYEHLLIYVKFLKLCFIFANFVSFKILRCMERSL